MGALPWSESLGPAAAGFAAGFLLAIFAITMLGRVPLLIARPVLRLFGFLFKPFVWVLRLTRILPKAAARTRPARNALMSATTVIEHGRHATETEKAFCQPDEPAEGQVDEDGLPASYDCKEERRMLAARGALFRTVRVPSEYFQASLTDPLSESIADGYFAGAKRFFNRRVIIESNEKALFEDVDGAVSIGLFRSHDRRCYFALNEMRKIINNNALRLVATLATCVAAYAALAVYLFGYGLVEPARLDPQIKAAVLPASLIATALAMFAFQHLGYAQQQRHNTRELVSFLTRYLGRLSDRYRESTAFARGVTVGDETDSKKLSASARKWHKIMVWMPFRAFFIESFVRNIYFQIHRNCHYYGVLANFLAILAVGAIAAAFVSARGAGSLNALSTIGLAASFGLVVFYLHLVNKVVIRDELNQIDWLGFDNLNVSQQMDDVVGKYAEDVGFWKGRFER
ncbi:MAG: hypothetical protein HXY23_00185 [Parvularculaceae bacterium]|nr:hypothetical protein [Parvularculaceae bacterium]